MPIACIVDGVSRDFLASRLNDQRKAGIFCDVLLKVSGHLLPTHACVLSASSPFFQGLICKKRVAPSHLSGTPQEIDLVIPEMIQRPHAMEGAELEVIADLLDYIYTGKIELKEGSVNLVVHFAEAFMLDGLASLIKAYVNESAKKILVAKPTEVPESSGAPSRLRTSCGSLIARELLGEPVSSLKTKDEETSNQDPPKPETRVLRTRKRFTAVVDPCTSPDEEEIITPSSKEYKTPGPNGHALNKSKNKSWFRMSRPSNNGFKCKQCNFESKDLQEIRTHKLLHPGNSYVCVSCGYVSRFVDKLLAHLRLAAHPETKCSLCGYEAIDGGTYIEHLTLHDGPKPFFCQFCDNRFQSRWCLKTHTRKHTSSRPWHCEVCNRTFKIKGALSAHMKTHGSTSAKNFVCCSCGFRTAYKHNLLLHERIHSGDMVKCPHEGCNHQSNSEYSIQAHLLIHSKEKPYQCEVCGAKFSHPSNLRQHAKLHNLEANTIHCEITNCPFTTLRIDKLRSHLQKIHGESPANS